MSYLLDTYPYDDLKSSSIDVVLLLVYTIDEKINQEGRGQTRSACFQSSDAPKVEGGGGGRQGVFISCSTGVLSSSPSRLSTVRWRP